MKSSEQNKVGPRAKCDQVVYEAIAKAAEVIVRGRCRCDNSNVGSNSGSSLANATSSGGNSNTGTRFYLEIEEVSTVRSILQMWKRSLHVPLRLDVYYEYCTDPNQPEQTTRKELLERWCIDYLPSHDGQNANSSGHGSHSGSRISPRNNADDTISQLRQVVKRVVIQLRVLFSLTRLMPAYRLHHALMDDLQHGNRNHAVSNLNRPLGGGPGLGGGYYQNSSSSVDNINQDTSFRDLVGGQINFSFYVSDKTTSDQRLTSDAALFSSSTNLPFARHNLDSISTPFGVLHLTGLYDESLNVENVLTNRANRIMEWGKVQSRPMSVPLSSNGKGNDYHHGTGQLNSDFSGLQLHHNPNSLQSRAIPIQKNGSARKPDNVDNHHQHRSHSSDPRGRQHYLQQMSMPDQNHLGVSPNLVSEHFRRNHTPSIDRPKSADPTEIRDRLGSDPGRGLVSEFSSKGREKRVLSGLSLALMNDDENQRSGITGQQQTAPSLGATPPSPLIQPSKSGEDISSIRQRMAFHHPPPSFDENSLPNAISSSPNQKIPTMTAQHTSLYGYGYNNGHHVIPPAIPGSLGPSRANSPSPMPLNTPPQPMFIGSHPRSGQGGTSKFSPSEQGNVSIGGLDKSRQGRNDDIPFRNPTTLQEAPVEDTGTSMSGFSSNLASIQNSFQTKSIVNTAQVVQSKDALLPPLTTLDALASSPFKLSQSVGAPLSNGPTLASSPGVSSVFSSLVMGKGSAAYSALDEGFPLALASGSGSSSAFLPSRSNSEHISRNGVGLHSEKEDAYDDMPFAVDLDCSNQCSFGGITAGAGSSRNNSKQGSNTIDFGASSSTTMSSQVVTSLAHRCSTAGRLKMFSDGQDHQSGHENSVFVDRSIVEDQLNEFRSFGDSITASGLLPPMKR